jgi:hypothetical protein
MAAAASISIAAYLSFVLLMMTSSFCMPRGVVVVEAYVSSHGRRSSSSSSSSSYIKPLLVSPPPFSEDEINDTATAAAVEVSSEMKPPLVQTKSEYPPAHPIELTPNDMMRALGTSPRRIVLSLISSTGIALAGNLFGITSQILTCVNENVVEATGLDTYFPRGDYKRIRTVDYTFVIPAVWVADTALELAKAQRRVTSSLDYSMSRKSGSAGILPDAGE